MPKLKFKWRLIEEGCLWKDKQVCEDSCFVSWHCESEATKWIRLSMEAIRYTLWLKSKYNLERKQAFVSPFSCTTRQGNDTIGKIWNLKKENVFQCIIEVFCILFMSLLENTCKDRILFHSFCPCKKGKNSAVSKRSVNNIIHKKQGLVLVACTLGDHGMKLCSSRFTISKYWIW